MRARRFFAAAAMVGLFAAAACQQQAKPKPTAQADAPPADQHVADSLRAPLDLSSPPSAGDDRPADAVAQQVQSYAQAMESLVERRSTAPRVNSPAPAPAQRDPVGDSLDPSQFRIAPAPRQALSPAVQSTPVDATVANSPPPAPVPVEAVVQTQSNTPAAIVEAPMSDARSDTTEPPAVQAASISADALHQQIARRVSEYPRDVCSHLEFQLLQFLRDEPVPHLQSLSALPAEDRELVTAVIDALSNFRHTLRSDNNMLLSRKMKPLLDMSDRLRSQAELTIPTLALCSRVDAFGLYSPMEPRFIAEQKVETIIYCEIENLSSHLNDNEIWETNLTKQSVLYTETGMPVWEDKPEKVTDLSRARRRDFFIRKRIELPASLQIGRYLLKVTIIDDQANRVAEASLPIVYVAK